MRTTVAAAAWLVIACNPSVVAPTDPLHEALESAARTESDADPGAPAEDDAPLEFYLALPLSGPAFRHANVFGEGDALSAGTRVLVDRIERGEPTGEVPPQWAEWYPETIAHVRRVYRIYFHTAEGQCGTGCQAHWRAADDADFERRFGQVFTPRDPLAGLDAEARRRVADHEIDDGLDADLVRLAIGAPNTVVETGTTRRWVYEARYCRDLYLVAEPELAVELDDRGRVRAREALSATDFYYPLEPLDPLAGLCDGDARLNPWLESRLAFDDDGFVATPLERQMAPDRPPHRVRDLVEKWEEDPLSRWRRPPEPTRSHPWGGILAQ